MSVRGQRPRPRVAVVGDWSEDEVAELRSLFPTVWTGSNSEHVLARVAPGELDLVLARCSAGDLVASAHVIAFSRYGYWPGPVSAMMVTYEGSAESEEYELPEAPLLLDGPRRSMFAEVESVRGWPLISLQHGAISPNDIDITRAALSTGALAVSAIPRRPLAIHFLRSGSGLGCAVLPPTTPNALAWVRAFYSLWANTDPERLPGPLDWERSEPWLTHDEALAAAELAEACAERERLLVEADRRVAKAEERQEAARAKASAGLRRLLTQQGDTLVDAVQAAFESLGFEVTRVDEVIGDAPKREDLRLRLPGQDGGWEAIVEVRGYEKSAGRLDDLQRLERFARLFVKEKGRDPNQIIYVVNGQLGLPPTARLYPLASNPEDVATFAEDGGLVMSSFDLFRLCRSASTTAAAEVQHKLLTARGYFAPPPR